MEWFLERLQHANPTLDYPDLCNHGDDFKKLVDLQIIKYTQQLEAIACNFCDEDHLVPPFRNNKNELILSCSGSRRVVNPDELKIWTINKNALIENVKSKNPVIHKTSFEQTAFASNTLSSTKKYSDIKEPIKIKTLGIEIRGNHIFKGSQKERINDTDKCLIYFLYYKFTANKDECFKPDRLVLEIGPDVGKKSEGYIENRIGFVNKAVRELIIKSKTSIGFFIKSEWGRGYHLNPKIVI